MITNYIGTPETSKFSKVAKKLRTFFHKKKFVEVHTQDRLSILAACEDPTTVATYEYAGEIWPLPQTGQMWLEYELLKTPDVSGVFCMSTSFRNEPNPVPGRHKIIFPMFEFESKGTINELRLLEAELCEFLGFGKRSSFAHVEYKKVAKELKVREISGAEEKKLAKKHGPVVFLERFPIHTSPFWNMKVEGATANKIDVLLDGVETIGSAERSSDVGRMREQFHTISDGKYASLLYDLFGKKRVEAELEDFLSLPFIPRYGGGIGVSRLMKAMETAGALT
jgi:aspartyl/asparaginyl-tRNA synthetase